MTIPSGRRLCHPARVTTTRIPAVVPDSAGGDINGHAPAGGAGSPQHMLAVLKEGKADAALAASIFHFNKHSVPQVKKYLADRGVPVRLV